MCGTTSQDVVGHLVPITAPHLQLELVKRYLEYLGVSMRKRSSSSSSYITAMMVAREEAGLLFANLLGQMQMLHASMHPDEVAATTFGSAGVSPRYPFGVAAGYDERVWGFDLQTPRDDEGVGGGELNRRRGAGPDRGWLYLPIVADESKRAFICTTFEQSIARFPDDNDLRLNYIDFVAEEEAVVVCGGGGGKTKKKKFKAAKKICKAMLKDPRNRNNLVLLDRYAQLEHDAGKPKDAVKVYNTALSMANALPPAEQRQAVCLCRHLVELYLDNENTADALGVLLCFALGDDVPPGSSIAVESAPPTLLAKARNAFQKMARTKPSKATVSVAAAAAAAAAAVAAASGGGGAFGCAQPPVPPPPEYSNLALDAAAVDMLACQAWFEYIVGGCQLEKVGELYDAALDSQHGQLMHQHGGEDVTLQHERLFADYIHFIRQHSLRNTTRPSVLRNIVAKALEWYPSNPSFLSAFVLGEARCRVSGRVRRFFDSALRNAGGAGAGAGGTTTGAAAGRSPAPVSPVVHLFAIHAELLQMHGCSIHRVRTTLY